MISLKIWIFSSADSKFRLNLSFLFPSYGTLNPNLKYQTIGDAIKLVKHYGKGSLLSKTDIENSFRLVPINKQDYDLLGFSIDGTFYYDKTNSKFSWFLQR
jgi:hypothetical protein